jgi:hypothetical protein
VDDQLANRLGEDRDQGESRRSGPKRSYRQDLRTSFVERGRATVIPRSKLLEIDSVLVMIPESSTAGFTAVVQVLMRPICL